MEERMVDQAWFTVKAKAKAKVLLNHQNAEEDAKQKEQNQQKKEKQEENQDAVTEKDVTRDVKIFSCFFLSQYPLMFVEHFFAF